MNARDKAIQILEDPKASEDAKELARLLLREFNGPVVIPQPFIPTIPNPPYVPGTYPHPWESPIRWQTTCGGRMQ